MLDRKELIVNKDYQRGSEIWPNSASSYFIDTILQGFVFPKIYIYESMDRPVRFIRREIVDGQQRIGAIKRFYDGEFGLQVEGPNKGKKYGDLSEEYQAKFLEYSAPVDVIRSATRTDILQMFRRMNAYTMPLNDAEKRHSRYHGRFKWAIIEMADELNEFFFEFGVFTPKQITRMADATFISDCILALERGVISTNASDLEALYKSNDTDFLNEDRYRREIRDAIDFIIQNFDNLKKSFMMKPYALHSLITALVHCKTGVLSITDEWKCEPIGRYCLETRASALQLANLASAHEGHDTEGRFSKYVWGCLSTTDRRARRSARVAAILRVLGANVPEDVDARLT